MKILNKKVILFVATLIILCSFIYLIKIKEEKANKVPKSATLVLNYNWVDVYE